VKWTDRNDAVAIESMGITAHLKFLHLKLLLSKLPKDDICAAVTDGQRTWLVDGIWTKQSSYSVAKKL